MNSSAQANDLVIHRAEKPTTLFLLFHGVGATPDGLLPLGKALARTFPQSAVIAIAGRAKSDWGNGYQWFSATGVTEENRAERIAQVMPLFKQTISDWQRETAVSSAATALIGFSQGAIMALESLQGGYLPAARVIAIAGRFATPPERISMDTTIHLIHGKDDAVIAYAHTLEAADRLKEIGADFTADVLPYNGHAISGDMESLMLERLQGYLPQRVWQDALASAGKVLPHKEKE